MKHPRKLFVAALAAVSLASTAAAAPLVACGPECLPPDLERSDAAPASERRETVVLVHGLGRTKMSMYPLALALEREGYTVLNWGYSSYSHSIPELGRRLADELEAREGARPERIHFVGHSLGNVIVRWVLANDPPADVGRVVMLAPPNRGSDDADRYARWLGWLLRPLPELRTDPASTTRTIPLPEGVEVGVIAGRYDGKVTVPQTHLSGEAAHVVVPAAHTFIMNRGDVRRLIGAFLETGSFGGAEDADREG